MAGADVIEAAIGVSLLVIVGYTLVSSILASGGIVASAQQDMTMQNEGRMGTSIEISNEQLQGVESPPSHYFEFDITNTGSEIIGQFDKMDMFISNSQFSTNVPVHYSYIGVPYTQGRVSTNTWGYMSINPDLLHPTTLDPGETMNVEIFIGSFNPHTRIDIIVVTPNGVSAAGAYVP